MSASLRQSPTETIVYFANYVSAFFAPKVTSSFDRQAPPPLGAHTQREGKNQSPQRGGGGAAGGNSGGGQGRGGQGQGQGQDYYTLSRAGITHLKDSSSDFTTLDRWEREYALFHQIRRSGLKDHYMVTPVCQGGYCNTHVEENTKTDACQVQDEAV